MKGSPDSAIDKTLHAKTRYERWCFWERFTDTSSRPATWPPDSASTDMARGNKQRSGNRNVLRHEKANMALPVAQWCWAVDSVEFFLGLGEKNNPLKKAHVFQEFTWWKGN